MGLTEAIRSVSYPVLPRLLIIQLKRFSGGMEKINSYIPTPFTMQCFCSKCCALAENEKLHEYKLYSVITHVGATLSVGHYIAYTCALESDKSDYINCPKEKTKSTISNSNGSISSGNGGNTGVANTLPTGATTNSQGNLKIMKKIMFGRSKASSSGDVTKNLNGPIKQMTNGIDKSNGKSDHSTCQGLNCCGISMKSNLNTVTSSSLTNGQINGISSVYPSAVTSAAPSSATVTLNGGSDTSYNSVTGGVSGSGNLNSHNNHSNKNGINEPTWYMCDDDKIKAMSQREFEELLMPNSKKIMITPYLLFYARTDIQ